MYIIIMGCGRVGATLAQTLDHKGHTVAIVDKDPAAFRRLGSHFGGHRVDGWGFDRDVLARAGIGEAHAFAAVSSGDNSNIISARVARETFGVERVVARIYDPRRAEVYQRLGIPTVATVRWTADQMLRRLLPSDTEPLWHDPSGSVVLEEVSVDPRWVGETIATIERTTSGRVAFIARLGEGLVPAPDTVLQEGDIVHVTMPTDKVQEITAAFEKRPRGAEE